MRALIIEAPENILIREVEDPVVETEDDVLIRVSACGICGTDIHIYRGLESAKYPVIPGHEFCGVVEQVGKNAARSLKAGDRVIVDPNLSCFQCAPCRDGKVNHCVNGMINQGVNLNGGYAEFASVNVKQCYRIPNDLSDEVAMLGEPLSCVLHGVDKVSINPSERVVIFGGGPIGVLIYKYLHSIMGLSDVSIVEINENRISAAKEVGVERIDSEPLCQEADIVFEASGSLKAFEKALRILSAGGRVVQFGVPPEDATAQLSLYDIYRKEISIIGSFVNPFTMSRAVKLLVTHQKTFSGIAGRCCSPEEAASILRGEISTSGFLKGVVKFQEES